MGRAPEAGGVRGDTHGLLLSVWFSSTNDTAFYGADTVGIDKSRLVLLD